MEKTWAISGVDLHLELGGTRVRAGLESALREAVRSGRLATGVALPSSRALAADLGISRNTVASAYGQLVAEGWLAAERGSGTRVAARAVPASSVAPEPAARQLRYDLRPGQPDVSGFPRSTWLTASRRALSRASAETFGYPPAPGRPELRTALAEYLSRARGVRADPECVVVCSGFAHGLVLLCDVLRLRSAKSVAVEAFGHAFHRDVIMSSGLRVAPLPVDADGAVLDRLGADAVLVTPAHQFPLGAALVPARRAQAVAWARDTGGLVIEDDYDGEFRYDRQPVGALQALAPEHVVYAGTTSKSLAPGLRLGWLVLPPALVQDVSAAAFLRGGPSALEQLTLAELIDSGAYDRHIRRSRLIYRRRRDRLVAALRRAAPAAFVTGIAGGLHAVVELPPGLTESSVIEAARDRGLLIEGLSAYATTEHPPALVVGYGTPPEHTFSTAVARLCAALSQ